MGTFKIVGGTARPLSLFNRGGSIVIHYKHYLTQQFLTHTLWPNQFAGGRIMEETINAQVEHVRAASNMPGDKLCDQRIWNVK